MNEDVFGTVKAISESIGRTEERLEGITRQMEENNEKLREIMEQLAGEGEEWKKGRQEEAD